MRYFIYILCFSFIVLLASCDNRDDLQNRGNVHLNVMCKNLTSRATANGVDAYNENKINRLDCFIYTAVPTKDWKWAPATPCTIVSLFEQGCVEKGLSYLEGGPTYNVVSPHIGGLPDVVNSLYAIKKLVFDEQKLLIQALEFTGIDGGLHAVDQLFRNAG